MSDLYYIERSDAATTGGSTPDEYLVGCLPMMSERGTNAASVARSPNGGLITPAGYNDSCVDVHAATGQTLACRRFSGEIWSPIPAVDYVVEHWGLAAATDPDRFGILEYGSTHWLYTGTFTAAQPLMAVPTSPVWDAALARFSPDGRRIVYVEFHAQPQVWVCTQDVRTGARRTVAALPQMVLLGDISISGDGTWALIGLAPMYLVNLDTSAVICLPDTIRTGCWYPARGPSAVLAARGDVAGPSEIGLLDLGTDSWEHVCKVESQIGGLDVSADDEIAAVLNTPGQDGWVPHVAVVDARNGSTEVVSPWRFDAGPFRHATQPRWTARQPAIDSAVVLSPALTDSARSSNADLTSTDIERYYNEWFERLQRRLRILEADPHRVIVLSQLVALADSCVRLNSGLVQAVKDVIIPALGRWSAEVDGSSQRNYAWAVAELSAICNLNR